MQGFADGGDTCFGVQATPGGLSAVEDGGVADSMGSIGAIWTVGWDSTLVSSLAERAEAGTAIAAKMAKISAILRVCRLAPTRLQNNKREATS